MTWTPTNPTSVGDPTKKDHYNKLWDNAQELADIFTAITNGIIGTDDPADFRVDASGLATDAVETAKIKNANVTKAKIGPDAVDDTKIGDAKIKKEHINADVVGAGLAGGAGTALSVDGIKDAGGTELKVKVVEIGDWDMDGTASVTVAHGLTLANIRHIQALVRVDENNYYYVLDVDTGGYIFADATNITLHRLTDGLFDGTLYNATSYNRGWVTIWYVA